MGDIRDQIDGYWDELEEPATTGVPIDQLNKLTSMWIKGTLTSMLWAHLAGKTKDYQGGQTITENFLYDPVVSTKNLKALGEIVSGNMGWDSSTYATYGSIYPNGATFTLPDKGSTGGNDK